MGRFVGKGRWTWLAVVVAGLVGCGGEAGPREPTNTGAQEASLNLGGVDGSTLLAVAASVSVSPRSTQLPLGEQHCVTATVKDLSAHLMANVKVNFAVVGANVTTGSALTDVSGQATFCYSGGVGGQDTIIASVGLITDTVIHVWRAVGAITLSPKNASHNVGQQHCVTATVLDALFLGVPGLSVDFEVAGAHTRSGSSRTNLSGEATFCYTGSAGGQDTLTANVALFSDTALHTWVVPNQGVWVSAGPDVSGYSNSNISLHGEAGDPDGDPLSLQWTYTVNADTDASATCTFSDAHSLTPAIRCTHTGSYTATLTVSDGRGSTRSDTAQVGVADGARVTMCRMNRYTHKTQQRLCGYATPRPGGAPIVDVWFTVDNGEPIHAWPPRPENESAGFVDTSTVLTEGTHVIRMHALSADDTLTVRSQVVTVDLTRPSLTILSPRAGSTQSSTVVTVTSSVADATPVRVSTQYVQTSEVPSGTGTVSHTVDLRNRGWQTILVRATDAANNFTEVRTQVYIE